MQLSRAGGLVWGLPVGTAHTRQTSHASYAATNQPINRLINQPHTTTACWPAASGCSRTSLQRWQLHAIQQKGSRLAHLGPLPLCCNNQHRASCQVAACIDVGAAGVQQGTHRVGCKTKHPPNSQALVRSAAVYVSMCPGCMEATARPAPQEVRCGRRLWGKNGRGMGVQRQKAAIPVNPRGPYDGTTSYVIHCKCSHEQELLMWLLAQG